MNGAMDDPTTRTVLAALSRSDTDPSALSRRRFLQIALASTAAAATPSLLWAHQDAAGAQPLGPHDGVVVVVLMGGGNDGLNTVVPYTDEAYHRLRGSLALAPESVLALDATTGLHPNLAGVKARYDAGQVALLRGVGLPSPSLSHFDAMAMWMAGWSGGMRADGWIGRYLSGLGDPEPLLGVVFGDAVPLHFRGPTTSAVSLPKSIRYTVGWLPPDAGPADHDLLDLLGDMGATPNERGRWADALGASLGALISTGARTAPAYAGAIPADALAAEMTLAARLINLDLGTRAIGVSFGDFDTHANQPGRHAELMARFDAAVEAFFAALDPAWAGRVTLLTMSEFGRRVVRNSGAGTDHGTASTLLAIGAGVRGGIYGDQPSLTSLDRNGNLVASIDTRSVYATVLSRWLGADARAVLGGDYGDLGFLSSPAAPGTGGGDGGGGAVPVVPVVPPAPEPPDPGTPSAWVASSFVALSPERVLDTRGSGPGKPGAGAVVTLPLAGRSGIPATGATAVVLNVTATEADGPGFVTVWPDGPMPLASSLNLERSGQTRPNLVSVPLGADGAVRLSTYAGAHLVADVVGYYVPADAATGGRLQPLAPSRLLDTRAATKPGAGDTVTLPVAGRNGVPAAGAGAVVLNVTATEADGPGYVTVWPGGTLPLASNLNLDGRGQTIANQVMVPLGTDGAIRLFTLAGAHLVVDIVGWYTDDSAPASSSGMFVPLRPERVLDTRPDAGLAGGDVLDLVLSGRSGVPASGVGAVVLNVTVTEADGAGYVTVWPHGEPPLASNVNVDAAGQTIANHVVTPLGEGGAVRLTSYAGAHLVADITGYFTS